MLYNIHEPGCSLAAEWKDTAEITPPNGSLLVWKGRGIQDTYLYKEARDVDYRNSNMRITPTGQFQVKEFKKTSAAGTPAVYQETWVNKPSYVTSDGNRYLYATGDDNN